MNEKEPQVIPYSEAEIKTKMEQNFDEDWHFAEGGQRFLSELLSEPDRFARVFKTEKGSYYFVLDNGKSLRIKYQTDVHDNQEEPSYYELQPLMQKIYGLNGDLTRTEDRSGNVRSLSFQSIPLEKGQQIIEVGISQNNGPVYQFKEDSDGRIEASEEPESIEKRGYQSPIAYHLGHSITEIIK